MIIVSGTSLLSLFSHPTRPPLGIWVYGPCCRHSIRYQEVTEGKSDFLKQLRKAKAFHSGVEKDKSWDG